MILETTLKWTRQKCLWSMKATLMFLRLSMWDAFISEFSDLCYMQVDIEGVIHNGGKLNPWGKDAERAAKENKKRDFLIYWSQSTMIRSYIFPKHADTWLSFLMGPKHRNRHFSMSFRTFLSKWKHAR